MNLQRCKIILLTISLTLFSGGAYSCEHKLLVGFDSRLKVELIKALKPSKKPSVDMVHYGKNAIMIAYPNRLIGISQGEMAAIPSLAKISHIASSSSGSLLARTNRGFWFLTEKGLKKTAMDQKKVIAVFGDNGKVLLMVENENDSVKLNAVNESGEFLPIIKDQGHFRTGDWNENGLAWVSGDALYFWDSRKKILESLMSDKALRGVRDVCAVGDKKVLVMTEKLSLLVTQKGVSIVAAFSGQCSAGSDQLLLFDDHAGLLWSIDGIDQLGDFAADKKFAYKLLSEKGGAQKMANRLEAERILGCEKVDDYLGEL